MFTQPGKRQKATTTVTDAEQPRADSAVARSTEMTVDSSSGPAAGAGTTQSGGGARGQIAAGSGNKEKRGTGTAPEDTNAPKSDKGKGNILEHFARTLTQEEAEDAYRVLRAKAEASF